MLVGKFKLFDKAKPKTIYRNIVEGAAKIYIRSNTVNVVFGKKAFNPLIMDWISFLPKIKVPWMDNKLLQYDFEWKIVFFSSRDNPYSLQIVSIILARF